MTRTQSTKCRKIAEKYGMKHQEGQAVSELIELAEVLTRRPTQRGAVWAAKEGKTWTESLLDEMADVLVMVEQLRQLHGISNEALDNEINYKLNRQLGRIEKGDVS